MSSVASLFNVPTTPEELAIWASAHMSHHRDINRRIFELTGAVLPEYVLDPINPRDTGNWENQHQEMHEVMDAILGIQGFDLTNVNFLDADALAGWINLHSNEHYIASNTLQIG